MDCETCSTPLPDGARFCPSCGTARATGASPGERRKVVTALFCDLVGSTALSGVLEPETLREVVLRYFTLMRQQIEAHGGTVEKFIGDAVMAVFGVPAVHEDDVRRAASAALDMVSALDTLNAELDQAVGCRLHIRVGINTGEVVTSADLAARQQLVSGEVVNIAARLEQYAGPGEILIGPLTRTVLGATAVVTEIGPLRLKGKTESVTACRLIGIRPNNPELTRRFDAPFIGREREIEELRAVLHAVADGSGCRLVTVLGEAGAGKTRLIREWLLDQPDNRILLGLGRCHPYRDQATLMPLANAVRQVLGNTTRSAGPVMRVLRTGLLADGMPSPSLEGTCAAIATVLGDLADDRVVVLVLDDIHWADTILWRAIEMMTAQLSTKAVLVVCAGRPEQLAPARSGPGGPNTHTIALGSMSTSDMNTLAESLAEVAVHGAFSTATAVARAEGNPFHLEQLLAMLAEGTEPGELPATVAAALAARIDALPTEERQLLDAASVIGRQFRADQVGGLLPELDRQALSNLVLRRLIEPEPGPSGSADYRFSSGLVREVTYQGIPKRHRAQWHEELVRDGQANPAEPAVGGHHLAQAYRYRADLGQHDAHTDALRLAAAAALTEAGRLAMTRADLSWSEDLYRRAFEHANVHDPLWTQTAQGLGEAWFALGRETDAGSLLREVLRVATAAGDRLRAAHAELQLAVLDTDTGNAGAVAASALPLFRAAGDDLGLARTYVRLAQEQQQLGQHGAAQQQLASAVRHAARADAEPERAMALGAAGVSLWLGPTPAKQAIARCEALLDEHGHGRTAVVVTVSLPLALLLALQSRFDEARARLGSAQRLAQHLGYAEAAVFVPWFTASVEFLAGDLERAELLLRKAMSEAGRSPTVHRNAARDLARVCLARGVLPTRSLTEQDPCSLPRAEAADLLGVSARVLAERDRPDAAIRAADRAVAEAEATDSPVTLGTALLDLAEVCLRTGKAGRAATAAAMAGDVYRTKGHLVGIRRTAAIATAARRAIRNGAAT